MQQKEREKKKERKKERKKENKLPGSDGVDKPQLTLIRQSDPCCLLLLCFSLMISDWMRMDDRCVCVINRSKDLRHTHSEGNRRNRFIHS